MDARDDMPPLVWVDFNDMVAEQWVAIRVDAGSDLARLGIRPKDGLRLRIYDDDEDRQRRRDNLVAEGTLGRYPGSGAYGGVWAINLDYLSHESDLHDEPNHWCHSTMWDEETEARRRWFAAKRSG